MSCVENWIWLVSDTLRVIKDRMESFLSEHFTVSVGGSGGLFVGASLLTFIELLYYFTLRPCGGGDEDDDEEKPLTANDID